MPPPAVPVKRDNGSGGSGGQASSSRPRAPPGFRMDRSNGKAAGTGKEKEVLGGDDDFQLLGSSNPSELLHCCHWHTATAGDCKLTVRHG